MFTTYNVMNTKKDKNKEVHKIPKDFKDALILNNEALKTWQVTTDNAKKNWLCWIISPKKIETRKRRIIVGISQLSSGQKRPCCFEGCRH
jgi:uncharacterized protein YdeI (YjbR/CyaY-like superfamily)